MSTNRFVLSGIAGGIAFFLLGYLAYGVLLVDLLNEHTGSAIGVGRPEVVFWAIGLGNLCWGFILAYVLINFANVNNAAGGVMPGAILGLLAAGSFDLVLYGTTNLYDFTAIVVDIITFAILSGFSGAAVGAVAGAGTKST